MFSLAFRNLWRNPRRTLAVLLIIAAGIAALIIFQGFNRGAKESYREGLAKTRFGHSQIFKKGYYNQVLEQPWEHWIDYRESDLKALEDIPGVEMVFPRLSFSGLVTNGDITIGGFGQGVDAAKEEKFFKKMVYPQGRALTGEDKDGIIIGEGLAKALSIKAGDRVTILTNTVAGSINGSHFEVVGVFNTGRKDFDDHFFRISLTKAFQLLRTHKIENYSVALSNFEIFSEVENKIKESFDDLEIFPLEILDKVYYGHALEWQDAQYKVTWLIIILMVILGIFNIITMLIFERRQEIGNLRANGFSKKDILIILCLEGALLGWVAGLVGVVISFLLRHSLLANGVVMPPAPGVSGQGVIPIIIQWSSLTSHFATAVCAALLATFFAAIRVLRQSISQLLRAT